MAHKLRIVFTFKTGNYKEEYATEYMSLSKPKIFTVWLWFFVRFCFFDNH